MAYVRLVHPDNFDHNRGQFNDMAFKKSGQGGMSIFDVDCAMKKSGSICAHIDRFYKGVSGEPPIYCIFDENDRPQNSRVDVTLSDSGDDCHREIDGISQSAVKKYYYNKRTIDNFEICAPAGARPLVGDDLI